LVKNTRKDMRKTKIKKRIIRNILWIVSLVLVIGAGIGAYVFYQAYNTAKGSYDELDRGKVSDLREEEVTIGKDPISILVMGIENYSSENDNGRTDTLIYVTINPDDQTMKMLSIPRDTRVQIPGRQGLDKINHAYGYGGQDLTIKTVEDFLNLPVDYYVKVNFKGFKDVINELDGVTVDVPFDFWEYSDEVNRKKIYFEEGSMHLYGEEALAYARMRRKDSDFGRAERQKQVIAAAIDKASSVSTIFKIDNIAEHIGENITTNLKPAEIYALQKQYSKLDSSHIESLALTGSDLWLERYYFEPNEESVNEVTQKLKEHLEHTQVRLGNTP
jgi:polyisoprenyl-teichoic acid--peptidoglycan teichoic acid transferase